MSVDQQQTPTSLGTIVQLPLRRCGRVEYRCRHPTPPAHSQACGGSRRSGGGGPSVHYDDGDRLRAGRAPSRTARLWPDRRGAHNGCLSDGSRRHAKAGSVSGNQPEMPRFHEHAGRLFSPASPRRKRIVARMGRNRVGGLDERSEQSRAEGPRPNASSGRVDRSLPGSTAHIHHWDESVTSSRFTELVGRRFQRKRDSEHG